jgi:SAM-dependent methyltransferase
MLKMFHDARHGGDPDFWDDTWDDGQLDDAIRFCEVDPLRPLFERYVPAGTRLLEGGCGRGQYVAYYREKGVRVTGLDFAADAIRRLKRRCPKAPLCLGDVAELPFKEGSFDAYYSGGVVEHFESGPLPALVEAHRVLRPGGVLLVSVPYVSPLRRLSALWRHDRRFVHEPRVEQKSGARSFWQYAFSVDEFSRVLRDAGFTLRCTFPYAVLFGLYDLPLLPRLIDRTSQRRPTVPEVEATRHVRPASRAPLLKRLLVSEDRTVTGFGTLVEVAGRLCANMMMYVCTR